MGKQISRKEREKGAFPQNDQRVEQLIYAIQGMASQIKNLQDGAQGRAQVQSQMNVNVRQQPQQLQSAQIQIQQPQQPQQSMNPSLIYPQLNSIQ
eukprot:gnl/Chilomastix_caulleri/1554.p1 GENE.gnl/Chilomastix_caulleri/1554~~gnl/Chilomastix_caulleri/1554.p1  ORF type:complete len:95 (+),score=36.39 gnl/Chilomastix_caulleri/1554:271-555(+)